MAAPTASSTVTGGVHAPVAVVSTVPTPPTSAEADALQQVVQNASLLSESGRSTLRIQLVPEHLGRLEIRLVQEGDRVTTQLVAHEAKTEALLARNFDQLHRMLENAGLKVQQLAVLSAQQAAPVASGQEPAPPDRHAQGQQERQGSEQHARQGGHERRGGYRTPQDWKHQEWWG